MHVLQEFVFRRVYNPGYLHFRKLVEFTTSPPVSREQSNKYFLLEADLIF